MTSPCRASSDCELLAARRLDISVAHVLWTDERASGCDRCPISGPGEFYTAGSGLRPMYEPLGVPTLLFGTEKATANRILTDGVVARQD
jgi:hypothetical protein